ncbi:MAG: substrate-binding domain-containing protein [Deltaproteobacteria bacterium]|nr:substrate-binding domain-containing protein [Deltaproteobacteria bacterium]
MELRSPLFMALCVLVLGACGCGGREAPPGCPCAGRSLRLATTTSVEQTGLLADLLEPFTASNGITVQVLAVGSGQALALAREGEVDVVLVHDPDAEAAFVAAGDGVNPRRVMHNDFVLVGPPGDPAGLRGGRDATAAFRTLAAARAPFVSRGDRSGTHQAELRLWSRAAASSSWDGYAEAGQGQVPTLVMAGEKQAYCLTDRGTWIAVRDRLELDLLVEGDPLLHNPYSVIPVNPARHPDSRYVEAMALAGWLTSAEGQARIGAFRMKGQILFHPDAVPPR